jgi:hypothetical protein
MQSRATRRFRRLFAQLPEDAQRDARRAYRSFKKTPLIRVCSSRSSKERIRSIQIGLHDRALAVRKGDRVMWHWIGSHADYDRSV